jgi:hypothetical protein
VRPGSPDVDGELRTHALDEIVEMLVGRGVGRQVVEVEVAHQVCPSVEGDRWPIGDRSRSDDRDGT